MESSLFNEEKDNLTIIFQSNFDLESFEILIRATYRKSLSTKVRNVIMELKYVAWIEAMQLSQIALWISELKEKGKNITINPPVKSRVLFFLEISGFLNFLKTSKIDSKIVVDRFRNYGLSRNKPNLPLTFLNEPSFKNLVSRLQTEDYYNLMFEEVRDYAFARKAVILDTLIQELGINMYDHGSGRFSNLFMRKGQLSEKGYNKKLSPFEANFFNEIKSNEFLEILICDKGPGIANTLIKNYEENWNGFNECELIDMSTNETISSKTKEKRLAAFKNKLSTDIENLIPFSGLFTVRETVKKYRGLMLIRSGNSIVSYNSYGDEEEVRMNIYETGYKKLANFGGTQIKIVLPFTVKGERLKSGKSWIRFNEVSGELRYKYFSLIDYFIDYPSVEIGHGYETLVSDINECFSTGIYTSIVIDLKSPVQNDSKLMYVLVCQLMIFQKRYETLFTLVNFPTNLVSIINDVLSSKWDFTKAALAVYTPNYEKKVIGLDLKDQQIYQEIISTRSLDSEDQIEFTYRENHLFQIEKDGKSWKFRHNRSEIINFIISEYITRIEEFIRSAENGIYHREIKVLTPSGKYSPVYYELDKLLSLRNERDIIVEWIKLLLLKIKPDIIISVGKKCFEIVMSALELLEVEDEKMPHVMITNSNYGKVLDSLDIVLTGKTLFLFTDVVASGRTMNKIISMLDGLQEIAIASIVNLTKRELLESPKNSEGGVKVFAIIDDEVQFYDRLPSNWDYFELTTANPITNRLISGFKEIFNSSKTFDISDGLKEYNITKEKRLSNDGEIDVYRNNFLEKIVVPNYAFRYKVVSRNSYMPFMYNINLIIDILCSKIVDDIILDIQRLSSNYSIRFEMMLCLDYPAEPFRPIFKELLTKQPELEIIGISQNHIDHLYESDESFDNKGVIILDDAFNTGDSLFKLIEYCEIRNAKVIFCYLLINRSDFSIINKFLKIRKYGSAEIIVKYLFEGQLPIFKGYSNPIKISTEEIDRVKNMLFEYDIRNYIMTLQERNKYDNIDELIHLAKAEINPEIVLLRWKFEMAKHHISFRKDLATVFSPSIEAWKQAYLVIRILEHEREVFLKDADLFDRIFYRSFKIKICESIDFYLNTDRSIVERYDLLLVLFYFDLKLFITAIEKLCEKASIIEDLYPVIVVLVLCDENNQLILNKIKYVDRLMHFADSDSEKLYTTLKQIWELKDIENYADKNTRDVYIKAILKANFHDFEKMLDYIVSSDYSEGRVNQTWFDIEKMCKDTIRNINSLMRDNDFYFISGKVYPLVEKLLTQLNVGNRIVVNFKDGQLEEMKNDNYFALVETIKQIKKLVFERGLLNLFESNLRVEVKGLMRIAKAKLSAKFMVDIDIERAGCNVFCTDSDLNRMLINIVDNINIHCNGNKVLMRLKKTLKDDKRMIEILIYDNGSSFEKIESLESARGIVECQRIAKKYSGEFEICESVAEGYTRAADYKVCAHIILHDLSKEILNKPTYAEEDTHHN